MDSRRKTHPKERRYIIGYKTEHQDQFDQFEHNPCSSGLNPSSNPTTSDTRADPPTTPLSHN